MKNEFKVLGDENKKTEKRTKLYRIGLTINIILIVAIIAFVGYLIFFKPSWFYNIKAKKYNENKVDALTTEYKKVYSDFDIVSDSGKYYIIGNKNGQWEEITNINLEATIIGEINGKLYYYNEDGIYTVDLTSSNNDVKEFLKYKIYLVPDTNETGTLRPEKMYLVGNEIFFKYKLDIVSTQPSAGILAINKDTKAFDDATQIIQDVKAEEWYINAENKIIYYLNSTNEIHKYLIETKEDSVVISNVKSFQYAEGKILYLNVDNSYREPDNAVVQAVSYELCLYDLTTGETTSIANSPVYNLVSGSIRGYAEYFNGDVYYKNDNSIIRYNNGENMTWYTYEQGDLKWFDILDANSIKIFVSDNQTVYIVDGVEYRHLPSKYKFNKKTVTQ